MDGTPNDSLPGDADVSDLLEQLEKVDPADAADIAERIAEDLGAELDASSEEPGDDEELR